MAFRGDKGVVFAIDAKGFVNTRDSTTLMLLEADLFTRTLHIKRSCESNQMLAPKTN